MQQSDTKSTSTSTDKSLRSYGGGCRVRWQDDDGCWHAGTVANFGDNGDTIDVETRLRVGKDIRALPRSRVVHGWE